MRPIEGNHSESFILRAEALKRVADLKAYYPKPESAVMPILQLVQEEQGYISDAAIDWVAEQVNMPAVHVRELTTFYSMYTRKPRGKYHFQVCRTLSCAVLGSKRICQALEKRLGIKPGEVSADGQWSVEQVECLGSCGTAPMCEINDTYFENLTEEKVEKIIDRIIAEQPELGFSTVKDDLGAGLKSCPKSELK